MSSLVSVNMTLKVFFSGLQIKVWLMLTPELVCLAEMHHCFSNVEQQVWERV